MKVGDRGIISCVSRCGTCENCQKQLYSRCRNGDGWIMGYMMDGTKAEYVRAPLADNSLYLLPERLNEDAAVLLSDTLPSAHKIGLQNGDVKPGNTVAIVGAGPVCMGCPLTAQLYSPSQIIVIDMDDNRLELARELGATYTVNSAKDDTIAQILALTEGRGVDCAIEAVGMEPTWNICQHVVKEGGHLANVGVHGKLVSFAIEKIWIHNLTITTGLVNTNTTGMLLKSCSSGKLAVEKMATHRFGRDEIEKVYDVFKHVADEKALNIIINY